MAKLKNEIPKLAKALTVIALVIVAGAVFLMKDNSAGHQGFIPANPPSSTIPRIVDLGARKCIPCKMMAPILEELRIEYQGQFDVVFIDVWEHEAAIDQYAVRIIPTQIFFGSDGEELFRHEGFFSKEDILGKWKELGMELTIFAWKWHITSALAVLMAILLVLRWDWPLSRMIMLAAVVAVSALVAPDAPELAFAVGTLGLMLLATTRESDREWAEQTWDFTKQIAPLLLAGVFVAGLLLGRPGHEGLIPSAWVSAAVGDNSLTSTVLASVLGALMYFSTLTEVPIVQGLIGAGMGKGPALALLLAGPALSLPNMLVIRSILGTRKTAVYCSLVVVMATATGFIYGNFF